MLKLISGKFAQIQDKNKSIFLESHKEDKDLGKCGNHLHYANYDGSHYTGIYLYL